MQSTKVMTKLPSELQDVWMNISRDENLRQLGDSRAHLLVKKIFTDRIAAKQEIIVRMAQESSGRDVYNLKNKAGQKDLITDLTDKWVNEEMPTILTAIKALKANPSSEGKTNLLQMLRDISPINTFNRWEEDNPDGDEGSGGDPEDPAEEKSESYGKRLGKAALTGIGLSISSAVSGKSLLGGALRGGMAAYGAHKWARGEMSGKKAAKVATGAVQRTRSGGAALDLLTPNAPKKQDSDKPKTLKEKVVGGFNSMFMSGSAAKAQGDFTPTEERQEEEQDQDKMIGLLEKIEENTRDIKSGIGGSGTSEGGDGISDNVLQAIMAGGVGWLGGKGKIAKGGAAAAGLLKKGGKYIKPLAKKLPYLGAGLTAYEGVSEIADGNKGAGTGQLAGAVAGGAIGLLGGPIGVAIGATIGGEIGKWLGKQHDADKKKKDVAFTEAKRNRAQKLVDEKFTLDDDFGSLTRNSEGAKVGQFNKDNVGTAYGTYQFNSTQGTPDKFVKNLEKTNPEMAKKFIDKSTGKPFAAGTAGFNKAWKDAGTGDNTAAFGKAQDEFWKKEYATPIIKIGKKMGLDVNNKAVAEILASGATQGGLGGMTKVVQVAIDAAKINNEVLSNLPGAKQAQYLMIAKDAEIGHYSRDRAGKEMAMIEKTGMANKSTGLKSELGQVTTKGAPAANILGKGNDVTVSSMDASSPVGIKGSLPSANVPSPKASGLEPLKAAKDNKAPTIINAPTNSTVNNNTTESKGPTITRPEENAFKNFQSRRGQSFLPQ